MGILLKARRAAHRLGEIHDGIGNLWLFRLATLGVRAIGSTAYVLRCAPDPKGLVEACRRVPQNAGRVAPLLGDELVQRIYP